MTPFRLTRSERETGQIIVKSDVYSLPGGRFYWIVGHGSGWQAKGYADSEKDAYTLIDIALRAAIAEEEHEHVQVAGSVLVQRVLVDEEPVAVVGRRADGELMSPEEIRAVVHGAIDQVDRDAADS